MAVWEFSHSSHPCLPQLCTCSLHSHRQRPTPATYPCHQDHTVPLPFPQLQQWRAPAYTLASTEQTQPGHHLQSCIPQPPPPQHQRSCNQLLHPGVCEHTSILPGAPLAGPTLWLHPSLPLPQQRGLNAHAHHHSQVGAPTLKDGLAC